MFAFSTHMCFVQCTDSCQPPASTEEWFSDLMVCDIKPRNATLIWTQDEDTADALYIVLYDVIGKPIRLVLVIFYTVLLVVIFIT